MVTYKRDHSVTISSEDERWMRIALKEARKGFQKGEVPVGAIIVKGNELVARAHNLCEKEKDATSHAELLAIRKASKKIGRWELAGSTIFVTLKPCPMCAGAINLARIARVVYGCRDTPDDVMQSIYNLKGEVYSPSHILVTEGIMEKECLDIIQVFFKAIRERHR